MPHMPSMIFTILGWIVLLIVSGGGALSLVMLVIFDRGISGFERPHHYVYLLFAIVLGILFLATLYNVPWNA